MKRWLLASLVLVVGCGSEGGGSAGHDTAAPPADAAAQPDAPMASDAAGRDAGDDAGGPAPPFDWCDGAPPDAACYAARRDPASAGVALARAIADRYLALHPPAEQPWDWEAAVLMFSLTELFRVTGDARYLDYYRAWMDHHVAGRYVITTSDTCAPTATALILYEQLGDDRYRAVAADGLRYLDEDALRTEHGGINHWGISDILGVSMWLDSLFMFGNLLTRWAEVEGDPARLDLMREQLHVFIDVLQSAGGFYVHSWGWIPETDSDVFWGRGNGWVTAACTDYLRVRRGRGEVDDVVAAALRRQVGAIVASQDAETGMWWTVLNRPGESYLETSAGALFAYGMARGWRYGQLDADVLPVVARAMDGVRGRITRDEQDRPVVSGVSVGTSAGTFEYYRNVRVKDDLPYGVGAVILSLVETSGLPL
jgi:unsaturated rhamnogalacturonyl hydrolase